jgi:hypothetical protein
MECTFEQNKATCTWAYECGKKEKCCEYVSYQRKMKQIPGCFFSKDGERSYDRSFKRFVMENK